MPQIAECLNVYCPLCGRLCTASGSTTSCAEGHSVTVTITEGKDVVLKDGRAVSIGTNPNQSEQWTPGRKWL